LLTCLGEYFERVLVGCSPGLETSVCSKKPAQRRPLQAMAGSAGDHSVSLRELRPPVAADRFVTLFRSINKMETAIYILYRYTGIQI
jgi:hypothetical protein